MLVVALVVLWVALAYFGVIKLIRKQFTSKKPAEKAETEETQPIVEPEPAGSSDSRVRYLAV